MSERDLDQYLEGLGIDVHEEQKPERDDIAPAEGDPEFEEAAYEDADSEDVVSADGDEADGDADRDAGGGRERRADAPPAGDRAPRSRTLEALDDHFDMEAALAAGVFGVISDDLPPVERTESFLVNVLLNLDPTYAVEVEHVDDEIHVEVFGGDSGRIIGKGGRTLAALEFLANAVVNRSEAESIRVVIDVGGYKRRRDERLRQAALKAAARVRKSGYAVELEPMTAAERRVVHMAVADEHDILSESTGDGRARRVVIKPVE